MWFSAIAMAQWYVEGLRYYGHRGFAAARSTWSDPEMAAYRDLSARHYVVTGANAGLGRAIAEELTKRRATVHMVCRDAGRAEAARAEIVASARAAGVETPRVVVHVADVGSFASVRAFAARFKQQQSRLDGLVNNAGALFLAEERARESGLEMTAAVAVGGSFLLTGLLLPELRRAPAGRVVNVSSGGQYLVGASDPGELLSAEPQPQPQPQGVAFDGVAAYARAKRMQVELTKRWAAEPAAAGVAFHCMHPGWAVTPGAEASLGGFVARHRGMMRDAHQGADTAVWLAVSDEPAGHGGRFWLDRAEVKTDMALAGTAWSDADRERLWRKCEQVCGWRAPA